MTCKMLISMLMVLVASKSFCESHKVWTDCVPFGRDDNGNVRMQLSRYAPYHAYSDSLMCDKYITKPEMDKLGVGMFISDGALSVNFLCGRSYSIDDISSCRSEKVGKYTWSYMEVGIDVVIVKIIRVADCPPGSISHIGESVAAVSPEPDGVLEIPTKLGGKSVTSIGSSAFKGFTKLKKIKIPASVKSIDAGAFDGCISLSAFIVDNANSYYSVVNGLLIYDRQRKDLKMIEKRGVPFAGKKDLLNAIRKCPCDVYLAKVPLAAKTVKIPADVTSIMPKAFAGCRNLTNVKLPSRLRRFGYEAFHGCENLKELTIPKSVDELVWDEWEGFFVGGGGKGGYIKDNDYGLRFIRGLFQGCNSLKSVRLEHNTPDYWLENGLLMAKGGHEWRDSHDRVAIVKCLGTGNIRIPANVKIISNGAFAGCTGIMSFEVDEDNTEYSSVNGLLLSKKGDELVKCVDGEVSLPESVVRINREAFVGCSAVTAFVVNYDKNARSRTYSSVGGCLLSYDGKTLVRAANAVESVKVPDGVETVDANAFSGSRGVVEITFPSSVKAIHGSFDGCDGLSRVIFEGETLPEMDDSFGGFGKRCIVVGPSNSSKEG